MKESEALLEKADDAMKEKEKAIKHVESLSREIDQLSNLKEAKDSFAFKDMEEDRCCTSLEELFPGCTGVLTQCVNIQKHHPDYLCQLQDSRFLLLASGFTRRPTAWRKTEEIKVGSLHVIQGFVWSHSRLTLIDYRSSFRFHCLA